MHPRQQRLTDTFALVTGANRGPGAEFVRQALERGARLVCATARRLHLDNPRVLPLLPDVTDPEVVVAATAALEQDDRPGAAQRDPCSIVSQK